MSRSGGERHVAVLGGDPLCVGTVISAWVGSRGAGTPRRTTRLPGVRRDVLTILGRDDAAAPSPWPGGPLVWLVPERGPSMQELAALRAVCGAHRDAAIEPVVVVCVEPGAGFPTEAELEAVAASLSGALPEGRGYQLGVAVRSPERAAHTLGSLFDEIASAAGTPK